MSKGAATTPWDAVWPSLAGPEGLTDARVRDADDLEWLCTRRLDHESFTRVYLDATYVKTRAHGEPRFEAIIAAVGAGRDGHVEVLGIDVGDSESQRFWERLLFVLRVRGLHGVAEILTDEEHGGLEQAVAAVFPTARVARISDDDPLAAGQPAGEPTPPSSSAVRSPGSLSAPTPGADGTTRRPSPDAVSGGAAREESPFDSCATSFRE